MLKHFFLNSFSSFGRAVKTNFIGFFDFMISTSNLMVMREIRDKFPEVNFEIF